MPEISTGHPAILGRPFRATGRREMHKIAVLAILLAASFGASATKTNEGCQGNCPSAGGGTTNNEANSNANASSGSSSNAGAVGVGVGVGLGGQGGDAKANASGGNAVATGNGFGGAAFGQGGSGGDSSSTVKDSGNSFNANTAKGGNASQGQQQSNVGVNSQSSRNTNVSGSKSIAQMASENTNRVNASSKNANNSQASGNQTTVTNNIGGDSTLVERNAPPVFLGPITPTSCGGSFSAGGSDRNGSGAFGFSFVGTECAIRMLGDRYQALGMLDTSCELYKSTKAFQKAAKRNPKLAILDCSVKPAPAPVPVLVAPELAPRIPRG